MLTGKEKAVAAFVITTMLGIATGVSQVIADGTVKSVLGVVGIIATVLGTTLGVYQTADSRLAGKQ